MMSTDSEKRSCSTGLLEKI